MTDATLAGKIAVVTGAGRGIGKSIALAFARAGADVAICARRKDEIEQTGAEIAALGRRGLARAADMADPEQVNSFCKDILSEFGAVDVLVNNAGAYLERGAFVDSDPDLWWKTMEVNVRGPYLLTRHLLSAMRKGGKIINLTSGKGYSAGANSSAYHVSKAALNMMTEGLANELWQQGIEVNSLIPGPTATATFDNPKPGEERSPAEILSAGPDALPKGLPAWERVKHPDEVARMALQMASYPIGGPTGQVFSLARRPI
jgi:3-oxoacyl-[acyl-carrier protein] reductase